MFGYACARRPTSCRCPSGCRTAVAQRLAQVRRVGVLRTCGPTARRRVSVIYEDGRPSDRHHLDLDPAPAGSDLETSSAGPREHVIHRCCRPTSTRRPCGSSQPTGQFELGGPHADTGLTGRKSSSTPTAAWPHVVAPSPARTPPRWTVRPPTRRAGWPSTSWRPVRPAAARPVAYASVWPAGSRLLVETSGPRRSPRAHRRRGGRVVRPAARGHHPGPRPAPSHLPAHAAYAISAARTRTHLGGTPRWTTCAGPSGSDQADAAVGSKCGGAARA